MAARRDRERTTFLELSQIVERTNAYARRARDLLVAAVQRAQPPDERTRIFLEMLDRQRAELETAMDRAREEAPARLLATRVQYTIDPWITEPEPPRAASIDAAIRFMIELDEGLVATYREVAERGDNDSAVQEFFAGLADLIQGFDRRLALAAQTSHDV